GQRGLVCGGVCCDEETERQLQEKATKNFERLVKHHIRSQRSHWEQAANMYKDYLLQLTRQSENKTLILFSTVYSKMSPLSREPIRELYETIRLSLVATDRVPLAGDDLALVTSKFFRNLFPVAYHHAIHSDILHGTERDERTGNPADVGNRDFLSDYKNCLVHTYTDLKPFGMVPQQLSGSLVSTVSAASVLLRAIREGAEVLLKLEEVGVSAPSCRKALLRMNYCGSCKRYNHLHAKPCAGLCQNVMRGCLIEYVGALNKGWSTFTEAIVSLISSVRSTVDGIEAEIKSLDAKLSNAIMHAMEIGPQLEKQVGGRGRSHFPSLSST
uniref:Dally n=1 Tax=Anopheles atroparvus TaxID=41427 RepID=A0A182IR51_ANOAO